MSASLVWEQANTFRRARRLPVHGEVLASLGQLVAAEDLVARAVIPGVEVPVEVSQKLGLPGSSIEKVLRVHVGDWVQRRDIVALNSFFGLFAQRVLAPCSGQVETVAKRTGTVILRTPSVSVQCRAYLPGRVVEALPEEGVVIETRGIVQPGVFGVGGERIGRLLVAVNEPNEPLQPSQIASEMNGAILVGGSSLSADTLRQAARAGVAAIVTGSIDDSELAAYLGYEIRTPITGQESVVTALILTEGFGRLPMCPDTFRLLRQHAGSIVSANGTTHLRSDLVKPEVVIPLDVWG